MNSVPTIKLNNDVEIPQLGFGVFKVPPEATKAATLAALEVGYRHIDTAEMYGNEQGVGQAIREFGIAREDVFVTSKLNNGFHAHDVALSAFDQTLVALGFDYVDLFLIHWPLPRVGDFVETWKAMEEIYGSRRARAIGVSNFQRHHLQRILDETSTVPAVNQVEIHPYLTQEELRGFDAEHGVATEAWSPLAKGKVIDDPTIAGIAMRVGRSPAQVTLRWHIQRGDIVFPKSVHPERMKSNFELFDFSLDDAQMDAISGLDRGEQGRNGPNPDVFAYLP
jgi:2,5-diketo-D-gluconate reductase A